MPSEMRDKPPTVSGNTHKRSITERPFLFNHQYQSFL